MIKRGSDSLSRDQIKANYAFSTPNEIRCALPHQEFLTMTRRLMSNVYPASSNA